MTRQAHNSKWLNGITYKGINYTGPADLINKVSPPPNVPKNTVVSRLNRMSFRTIDTLSDTDIEHALYLDVRTFRELYGERQTKITVSGNETILNQVYRKLLITTPTEVSYSTFRSRLVNRAGVDETMILDAYSMKQDDWVSSYGGGRHRTFIYDGDLYPEHNQKSFHSISEFLKVIDRYKDKSLIWNRLKNNWPLDCALSTPRQINNDGYLGRIYGITLTPTGQIYVGLTVLSIEDRWKQHLITAKDSNTKLARAIQKHGAESFEIYTLEDNITVGAQLSERERYWVDKLGSLGPNGLNSTKPGGLGGGSGKPVTVDERRFKSISAAGRIIGKEVGIAPYVVNRCIREGKKIPKTQRRHSKHSDAGTDIFRRHLALLARHEGNIETRWLCYDLFKSDVGDVRPGMKLSRKDNTKPWGPNNFEWMSSPNAMKVTHGKPIIIFGTTYLCIEDAAAHFGIATSTLKHRIYKQKLPPEESVTKPVRKKQKRHE